MKTNPVQAFLKILVDVQIRHPVLVLLAALALAALSMIYTARGLVLHTSQKDLISPKERLIQLAEKVSQFEELDSFVVVIEGSDPRRSLEFLHKLVPLLEPDKKNFQQVFYRINPDAFEDWNLLYLDQKDLRLLIDNFQEHLGLIRDLAGRPTLVNFFEQINREMSSRMVGELFTGFLDKSAEGEPLDLEFPIRVLSEMIRFLEGARGYASPWESFFAKQSIWDKTQEGYFWTKDKKYLLVLITPIKKHDFVGTKDSLDALRAAVARVKAGFPDVDAGVTGAEALNADQMGTAFDDMGLATLISLVGLTLLYMIFWWSIRRPLFESIMLLIGLAWCFGLITLFIGHLNILSVTFAPLIIGLGEDYGAHWFARYQEKERAGAASKEALLESTMQEIGPGILLAGLTLSLSFVPLALTGFRGLVELGVICIMGLIITTVATLGLLPAMMVLFEKFQPVPKSPVTAIRPFIRFTRRRMLIIIVAGLVSIGLSVWQAMSVKFDLNILHLQAANVESVVWEEKLLANSELSSIYAAVLAPSLQEVRRKTAEIQELPNVASVESLDDMLPENQTVKSRQLRKLAPVLDEIGPMKRPGKQVDLAALKGVLGRIRSKMVESSDTEWGINKPLRAQMLQVRKLIDQIRGRIDSLPPGGTGALLGSFQQSLMRDFDNKLGVLKKNVNGRPMIIEDLPVELRQRYMTRDGLFIIRAYPAGNVWDPAILGKFVRDLRAIDPDVIGDPVTLSVFTQEFRDSSTQAALLSIVFIFVLLIITFRNLKAATLAIIPLLIGTVWTFGLMPPFGISLNLANSIFLPLIVGAGVEYGIIIVYRWRQKEKNKLEGIVLPYSTAMGIIVAGLSTTVGFCSLMVASHRGIFSLGLLTTIGSLAVLLAAIIVLPVLLRLLESETGGSLETPASFAPPPQAGEGCGN